MNDLLHDLVEARLPWTSPVVATWYSPAQLRAQWTTALQVESERLDDAAFGEEFRDAIGEGPAEPLAWANRRLTLEGGGWAVTGIRFRGRDARRPFVDVVATTRPPTPDGLSVVADAVLAAYDAFAPLCLRVDAPDATALVEALSHDPRFGPRCGVDQHVVAGRVEDLRAFARAWAYPVLTLTKGKPEEMAERAAEIYADLRSAEPALAEWAGPEDADSLAESADQGLLFEVYADDTPAGVVAAVRRDDHGLAGFVVQELCLDAAHRGRRLASATVQRLVDELPAVGGDVLWGTIHQANQASLRNALSIGRRHVGGYVWVTPAGLPGMPGGREQD